MSYPSHHDITVSSLSIGSDGAPRYLHLFTTEVPGYNNADHLADLLRGKFPLPQYKVSVTRWTCTGKEVGV